MIGSTEYAGEESSRNKGDQGSHSRPKVLIAELYLGDHWEGLTNPKGSYRSSLEGKRTGELTPPPSLTIETPGEQDPPERTVCILSTESSSRIRLFGFKSQLQPLLANPLAFVDLLPLPKAGNDPVPVTLSNVRVEGVTQV